MNGDVIGVETETGLLVNEEIHDLLALVTLELDHLASLLIIDLVAIASYRERSESVGGRQTWGWESRHTEFLPEEGQNLAGVELSRKTSDSGQRLATIALCCKISANCFLKDESRFLGQSLAYRKRATSDKKEMRGLDKKKKTYVEYGYGCDSRPFWYHRCRRRLRRRGL